VQRYHSNSESICSGIVLVKRSRARRHFRMALGRDSTGDCSPGSKGTIERMRAEDLQIVYGWLCVFFPLWPCRNAVRMATNTRRSVLSVEIAGAQVKECREPFSRAGTPESANILLFCFQGLMNSSLDMVCPGTPYPGSCVGGCREHHSMIPGRACLRLPFKSQSVHERLSQLSKANLDHFPRALKSDRAL
jgi:hypothetical protein